MLFDALNRFSDKQGITATGISENVIDLGVNRDLAVHSSLEVAVVPCQTDDSEISGEGTLRVELQTSEQEDFAESLVIAESPEFTTDQLENGIVAFKLPYGGKRYLRLNYVVTGSLAGLVVTAGLVIATPHDIHYPRSMHS